MTATTTDLAPPALPTARKAVRHSARHSARGFSLLELMLVLVIIGLLMGVASVAVVQQGKQARVSTTKTTLRVVSDAINNFQLQTGSYPATLQILETGSANQAALLQPGSTDDAWKNQLYYKVNEGNTQRPYELISAGEDKEFQTDDDINLWIVMTE